ncbi:MAG TPA: DUF58 domain-containing protein [Candidatus Binataceae bacterium]|nr:DUF58 domain-containing protein [Candidatus Binataceae bacterium]
MLEARAFEPEFLKKLDRLVLGVKRARTVRAGQRTLGRIQGLGIEPENFREYNEGDDLRFLDWNVYARLDELSIRTFRAERQVEITMLVDASGSMAFPERDDKLGLAFALAASLAYVGMSDNDAVRIGAFAMRRGAMQLDVSPFYRRRESYLDFRPFVTEIRTGGETRMGAAVDSLLHQRRPAGIVIVISDFLLNRTDYEDALSRLLAARHQVKVIHVLGEIESTGGYPPGLYRVRDAETGELRETVFGPEAAAVCRRKVEQLAAAVRGFCTARGIAYAQAFGAGTLDTFIERELPALGVVR